MGGHGRDDHLSVSDTFSRGSGRPSRLLILNSRPVLQVGLASGKHDVDGNDTRNAKGTGPKPTLEDHGYAFHAQEEEKAYALLSTLLFGPPDQAQAKYGTIQPQRNHY